MAITNGWTVVPLATSDTPRFVVEYGFEGVPDRPPDAIAVYWVGPLTPPRPPATYGDLWFNTAGLETP